VQYEDDVQLDPLNEDAWLVSNPEPSNLIVPWPYEQCPEIDDILAAVSQYLGHAVTLLDELDIDAPEVPWGVAIELPDVPGLQVPLLFWVEPFRQHADSPPVCAGCRWVIGVETMLDLHDPLTSYCSLMRVMAGSFPTAPAILDLNTTAWLQRDELEREYLHDAAIEPPSDVLWTIHAVQQQQREDVEHPCVWLHTHGLWRCGLPELEMLEVPSDQMQPAAMLLNDVASMTMEQRPAQPGQPYEIGGDLRVVFQPWDAVAPFLTESVPGAMRDRQGEANIAHTGVRAVVCDEQPVGSFRKLWVWPSSVLDKLQQGSTGLYLPARTAQRQAKLAQLHWPQFVAACDRMEDGWVCLVKAAMDIRGESIDGQPVREHVWASVVRIDADTVVANLADQPQGDLGVNAGDEVTVRAAQVTDWQVDAPQGVFVPESAPAMGRALGLMIPG